MIDLLHVASQQARLHDTQSHIPRRARITRRVIGAEQIVVDGFRYANTLHLVTMVESVLGDTMNGIHRVVTPDHEIVPNVVPFQLPKDLGEVLLLQLQTTGTESASWCGPKSLQQACRFRTQIDQLIVQDAFNSKSHPQHSPDSRGFQGLIHNACQRGIDHGGASRSGFNWTPAFASYGDNNRTQMIRVAGPGHCEDRTVSAGCNPYLALAAFLAAGLDGIENKLDPGEPNLGNLYQRSLAEIRDSGIKLLPQSLSEAVEELRNDAVVKSALGVIADDFIELKSREWQSYHKQVSAWEVEQYLTAL